MQTRGKETVVHKPVEVTNKGKTKLKDKEKHSYPNVKKFRRVGTSSGTQTG